MNNTQFHRHDLIWLAPAIDVGLFATANQADEARNWVMQGFPLVVTRQSDELAKESNQIMLGFTLPSAPTRTRVLLRANRSAIIRHTRPLFLSDAIEGAPELWRDGLKKLHSIFEKTGTVARVYGSLSSQIFTGMRYLDEASDLDLQLECTEYAALRKLLSELENFPLPLPRIDGEILSPSGWAVAWRELAVALRTGTPREVLAKSNCDAGLIPIEDFAQAFLTAT